MLFAEGVPAFHRLFIWKIKSGAVRDPTRSRIIHHARRSVRVAGYRWVGGAEWRNKKALLYYATSNLNHNTAKFTVHLMFPSTHYTCTGQLSWSNENKGNFKSSWATRSNIVYFFNYMSDYVNNVMPYTDAIVDIYRLMFCYLLLKTRTCLKIWLIKLSYSSKD